MNPPSPNNHSTSTKAPDMQENPRPRADRSQLGPISKACKGLNEWLCYLGEEGNICVAQGETKYSSKC